jgi:hypothetical protein
VNIPAGTGTAGTSSYISVFDTTDQTIDSALSASIYTFNTVDFSNGITLVSSSRFTVSQPGIYNLEFSAQYDKTNSSNSTAYIWLRKNGAAVSQSNTSITLGGGANDRVVAAWNWYVSASTNDYYEIGWTADDDNTYLQAVNAVPGLYPAVPSIIATMGSVGGTGPQGIPGPSGSTFPYTGSAQITGSLVVTGSIYFTEALSNPSTITTAFSTTTGYNSLLIGPIYNSGSVTVVSGSVLKII